MPDPPILRETETFLHRQIPLTRAMGVTVDRFDETALVLSAPLGPNHNHLGTAFGGSLATLATLAGYTLVWLELAEPGSHIVIQESRIHYKAPVRGDFQAVAPRLDPEVLGEFRRTLDKTGKARLTLTIALVQDGQPCAGFTGTFVALR